MSIFKVDLLENQVAIITGGGTGIGKQIANELGKAGAKLVIAGRRAGVLKETEEEFRSLGFNVISVVTDIRKPEEVQNLVDQTVTEYGQLNILVNNAGGQFPKKAEELSPNGWNAVINTNLNGTFYMTQAAAKQMIKQETGGAITNILVSFLHRGAPGIAHSVAARNGVYGLMRTLALEWAKYNIRINSVGPGIVITEGMKDEMASHGDGIVENMIEDVPLKRSARLEEIGWLVTFLSSKAADYITGEFVVIDGGNSLGHGISFEPY